jgi:hypothetical protein
MILAIASDASLKQDSFHDIREHAICLGCDEAESFILPSSNSRDVERQCKSAIDVVNTKLWLCLFTWMDMVHASAWRLQEL